MNREEAAKGTEVQETKHSMKHRCLWHDYHRKGTYMLTLVVAGRLPLFGELVVHPNTFAHASDTPRVECSELGVVIQNEEIRKIPQFYPMVNVWKVCMMPDHSLASSLTVGKLISMTIHAVFLSKGNIPRTLRCFMIWR